MSKSQEKALKIATGVIVPLLAVAMAVGAYRQQMGETIVHVEKLEVRQDKDHDLIIEMGRDIKWIRREFEKAM